MTVVCGLVLVPVRLVIIVILFTISFIIGRLSVTGKETEPLTGTQRIAADMVYRLGRMGVLCTGIWVNIQGTQDSEATVLVAAPHSSFFDSVLLVVTSASVVAKREIADNPVLASIGNLFQVIWVRRKAADSRKATAHQIISRAKSPGWRPLLVFPEGTTTNGNILLKFRDGAFLSGAPIQPVAIHWGNTYNTVTWTYTQNLTAVSLALLTLSTPVTSLTITFLPTIKPSNHEYDDPAAIAERTRQALAQHLDLPLSTLSNKDAFDRFHSSTAFKIK